MATPRMVISIGIMADLHDTLDVVARMLAAVKPTASPLVPDADLAWIDVKPLFPSEIVVGSPPSSAEVGLDAKPIARNGPDVDRAPVRADPGETSLQREGRKEREGVDEIVDTPADIVQAETQESAAPAADMDEDTEVDTEVVHTISEGTVEGRDAPAGPGGAVEPRRELEPTEVNIEAWRTRLEADWARQCPEVNTQTTLSRSIERVGLPRSWVGPVREAARRWLTWRVVGVDSVQRVRERTLAERRGPVREEAERAPETVREGTKGAKDETKGAAAETKPAPGEAPGPDREAPRRPSLALELAEKAPAWVGGTMPERLTAHLLATLAVGATVDLRDAVNAIGADPKGYLASAKRAVATDGRFELGERRGGKGPPRITVRRTKP